MLADFEEKEKKYNDAAHEQGLLSTELEELEDGTDQYNAKVNRINELGKITGVFW